MNKYCPICSLSKVSVDFIIFRLRSLFYNLSLSQTFPPHYYKGSYFLVLLTPTLFSFDAIWTIELQFSFQRIQSCRKWHSVWGGEKRHDEHNAEKVSWYHCPGHVQIDYSSLLRSQTTHKLDVGQDLEIRCKLQAGYPILCIFILHLPWCINNFSKI